ncbi:hypothetical protein C8Q77DRAFT_1155846 [Trametes polyzona]|nr:hypothetical protein C8Q77DRAFT_1155846 [Trametes polyzona]
MSDSLPALEGIYGRSLVLAVVGLFSLMAQQAYRNYQLSPRNANYMKVYGKFLFNFNADVQDAEHVSEKSSFDWILPFTASVVTTLSQCFFVHEIRTLGPAFKPLTDSSWKVMLLEPGLVLIAAITSKANDDKGWALLGGSFGLMVAVDIAITGVLFVAMRQNRMDPKWTLDEVTVDQSLIADLNRANFRLNLQSVFHTLTFILATASLNNHLFGGFSAMAAELCALSVLVALNMPKPLVTDNIGFARWIESFAPRVETQSFASPRPGSSNAQAMFYSSPSPDVRSSL